MSKGVIKNTSDITVIGDAEFDSGGTIDITENRHVYLQFSVSFGLWLVRMKSLNLMKMPISSYSHFRTHPYHGDSRSVPQCLQVDENYCKIKWGIQKCLQNVYERLKSQLHP